MDQLDHKQIIMQIMDANRIILEDTLAFVQIKKIEKAPWLNPLLKANRINNKYGKIYNRFYEDCEVSREDIIALYKKANQD